MTIMVMAGTRPEAVKIAPMVRSLRAHGADVMVADTGQQPGRVREALAPFGLVPDREWVIERPDGGLNELVGAVTAAMDKQLRAELASAVVVQGDTTSAFATALGAHHRRVPVVHVEAGLRTDDRDNPFPEESNRRLIAALADLHLAPTPRAALALKAEGVNADAIVITGNTAVDALDVLVPAARERAMRSRRERRQEQGVEVLVVTVHRREAWGDGVDAVADAVEALLARRPALRAVVVTHPNPEVAAQVRRRLGSTPRCRLLPPQPYDTMLSLLISADVILTDSGGIQEEAPTLGVPVVVARRVTERPEGVDAGVATLAGLDRDRMVAAVTERLDAPALPHSRNPYGDGRAGERCAKAVLWMLGRGARPADWLAR